MPRAETLTKQAMFTLAKLHSELAGKTIENKKEAGGSPSGQQT